MTSTRALTNPVVAIGACHGRVRSLLCPIVPAAARTLRRSLSYSRRGALVWLSARQSVHARGYWATSR